MIDWHHPRIYERLRCFGLTLFTLGVASHNVANPPIAVAAIVVAILLVVRLRIELEIGRDEEETSLERKLRHIDLINALAMARQCLEHWLCCVGSPMSECSSKADRRSIREGH